MGGRNIPSHERKKPKEETRKESWPTLSNKLEQVLIVRSKGKKGEG